MLTASAVHPGHFLDASGFMWIKAVPAEGDPPCSQLSSIRANGFQGRIFDFPCALYLLSTLDLRFCGFHLRCTLIEIIHHVVMLHSWHHSCALPRLLSLHVWLHNSLQAFHVHEVRCDLLSPTVDDAPKSGGPFPSHTFAGVAKCESRLSAACVKWKHVLFRFDATKGFPGEGPDLCSLVSANIGSLNTNHLWKSWGADITCLQETRVGKNNVRTSTKNIEAVGLRPILGQLLPGLWHANGTTKTP